MPISRRTASPSIAAPPAWYATPPAVGRTSVDRMPSSVVLPAPLWPSSAHIERPVSSRLTLASARSPP
jgi:hypothetical protein